MKQGRNRDRLGENVEIDLAPMIDCVFILLIFFIVTSVFIQDPGIRVDRPDVPGESRAENDSLVVAIAPDDTIYFDGQSVPVDNLAAAIRNSLIDPSTPLVIRADRAASHGIFAEVHAAAREAGARTIQFATKEGG